MPSDSASQLRPALRFGLAALALVLAGLATAGYLGDDAERAQLVELAERRLRGSQRIEQIQRLERVMDPDRGRLLLARALVAKALQGPDPIAAGSVVEAGSAGEERTAEESDLELVRRLSAEAGSALPASWEAPMFEGAATYLEWSMQRDERLVLEADRWQRPLLESLERGPGESEANRFLAAAYLELWPFLAPQRQAEARQIVRHAMEDIGTFQRLIRPWLARAGSRTTAFQVLPNRSWAFEQLRAIYAEEQDWGSWSLAHAEFQRTLLAELDDDLQEADARLRGGDPRTARQLYLGIAHAAPASREGDALTNTALLHSPPSVANRIYIAGLRRQLDRALTASMLRKPLFEPPVIARLAQAAGELEPAVAAHAMLLSGNFVRARQIERRYRSPQQEAGWAPYFIAKAEHLLGRGDPRAAAEALARVEPSWQGRLAYWRATEHQARASADTGLLIRAENQLARFTGNRQPSSAWRRKNNISRLEWTAGEEIGRIVIELIQVPAAGAVVEVRADGQIAEVKAIRQGSRLRLDLKLAAGEDHLLEIFPLTGASVVLGEVTFHPASA